MKQLAAQRTAHAFAQKMCKAEPDALVSRKANQPMLTAIKCSVSCDETFIDASLVAYFAAPLHALSVAARTAKKNVVRPQTGLLLLASRQIKSTKFYLLSAMNGNATSPQPPGQRLPPDPLPPPAPPPARCGCKGFRTRAEDLSAFEGLDFEFPESSTVMHSVSGSGRMFHIPTIALARALLEDVRGWLQAKSQEIEARPSTKRTAPNFPAFGAFVLSPCKLWPNGRCCP